MIGIGGRMFRNTQTRRRLPQTLERLGQGEVFDERDDTCIRAIGGALVEATNARCNGYGNRVLKDCTHEDVIMDAQLETLRWLLLKWDSF